MIKEFTIKYDDSRKMRLKSFFIPYRLLESTQNCSHDIFLENAKRMYPVPSDAFVSWAVPNMGMCGFNVVLCSEKFPEIGECDIIPEHDRLDLNVLTS